MISITSKSPYALAALVELYRHGDHVPVPIGELARRRGIPVQFLEQLFATLRRGGVLRSQRGVKGGYSFARPPEEVTVLELVELLDGPVGQGATGPFGQAAEAARSVLAASTVVEVAEAEARAAPAPMYHIQHESPVVPFSETFLMWAPVYGEPDEDGNTHIVRRFSPGATEGGPAIGELGYVAVPAELVRLFDQRGW